MMKASVARPSGHQRQKQRTMRAIQAGLPNSSSFATIGMMASRFLNVGGYVTLGVNVNHIYINTSAPIFCQGGLSSPRAAHGAAGSLGSPSPRKYTRTPA